MLKNMLRCMGVASRLTAAGITAAGIALTLEAPLRTIHV